MFKKLLMFAVIVAALYNAWGWLKDGRMPPLAVRAMDAVFHELQASRAPPLHDQPYLIVYGRDSCGFTQQTLQKLRNAGIAHQYQSVDDRQVADVLHARMKQQGLDTGYYLLPVVDLNNTISIRPDNAKLLAQASELHLGASPK